MFLFFLGNYDRPTERPRTNRVTGNFTYNKQNATSQPPIMWLKYCTMHFIFISACQLLQPTAPPPWKNPSCASAYILFTLSGRFEKVSCCLSEFLRQRLFKAIFYEICLIIIFFPIKPFVPKKNVCTKLLEICTGPFFRNKIPNPANLNVLGFGLNCEKKLKELRG